MNIKVAKQEISNCIKAYLTKDSKGDYHFTYGMKPNDFITPTVNSYRNILRKHIKVAIEDTFRRLVA